MKTLILISCLVAMSYANIASRLSNIEFLDKKLTLALIEDKCAMLNIESRCNDLLKECQECPTQQHCINACKPDEKCMGYLFDTNTNRCGLWYGRNCTVEENYEDVRYYEKLCGDKLEKVAAKKIQEAKAKCPAQCKPVPVVRGALHNGKNVTPKSRVTYFCQKGKLVGSRSIKCVRDPRTGEHVWNPEPPMCI